VYLDLDLGLVKQSHHAQFDEAWFLQDSCPPAAQLLYDLGMEPDGNTYSETDVIAPNIVSNFRLPGTIKPIQIPWPPTSSLALLKQKLAIPDECTYLPLPLRHIDSTPHRHHPVSARAARVQTPAGTPRKQCRPCAINVMTMFDVGACNMAMIYMSPDPYFEAFEQPIDFWKFDPGKHPTMGLSLYEASGRLYLATMSPSTPAAKIPDWCAQIRGACLIKVNDFLVTTVEDVKNAFAELHTKGTYTATLLFAHPEIRPNLSHNGLPIVSSAPFSQSTHNQLNNYWEFSTVADHLRSTRSNHTLVSSGDIHNIVNRVMKLTHGELLKQVDWNNWQESEYLQLNQYHDQGMFSLPQTVDEDAAIFPLVWTYNVKALDGPKKARCICDGSPRTGQATILNETYTNCVDQTSSRLFYGIAAAENMLIFGDDVSNTFAEAPPPKQGFYIYPDCVFQKWWVNHKHNPPLADNKVIPILSAMQGHPESPRLWEKHADAILREIGLIPTVHELCLYSGMIDGKRIIFKCQEDDFAIAAPDKRTVNILLDMIDNELSIPMKWQGYLDMYNGIDVLQTRDYVKISCKIFINKIWDKYLSSWMQNFTSTEDRPTPLPTDPTWFKKFNTAIGDPNPKVQAKLAKRMQLTYRSGVGELIWAMTTTRPNSAYTSVTLSQANSAPDEHHYH
jgi:hypothetical protein